MRRELAEEPLEYKGKDKNEKKKGGGTLEGEVDGGNKRGEKQLKAASGESRDCCPVREKKVRRGEWKGFHGWEENEKERGK